jgi:hypothetical protein
LRAIRNHHIPTILGRKNVNSVMPGTVTIIDSCVIRNKIPDENASILLLASAAADAGYYIFFIDAAVRKIKLQLALYKVGCS